MIKIDKGNNENIISVLACIMLVICALVPVSINQRFGISSAHTEIRFNIILSAFLIFEMVLNGLITTKISTITLSFGAFLLIGLIGSILTFQSGEYDIMTYIEAFLTVLLPFAMVHCLMKISNVELIWRVLKVYLLLSCTIGLMVLFSSLIYSFRGYDLASDRAYTTIGEATVTAGYIFSGIVINFILISKTKLKRYYISLILLCICLVTLQTRGMIVLLILFMLYMLFKRGLFSTKTIRYIIIAGIGIAVFVHFNPELVQELIKRFSGETSANSNELRESLFINGVNTFLENPLFGYGSGMIVNRVSRVTSYITDIGNTHNQWVALLCEYGVIGTLFFIISIFLHIKSCRCNSFESSCSRLAVIIFVTLGFFFETYITGDIRAAISFWILVLLMDTCSREDLIDKDI